MNEDQIVKPIEISVVQNLIKKYYPDLVSELITYKGGGSFSAFTVGQDYIFRFSKSVNNKDSENAYLAEKELLDSIRSYVAPHELPTHIKFIQDSEIFSGAVWVSKQFHGVMLKDLIDPKNNYLIAELLGNFLGKLHSISLEILNKNTFQSLSTQQLYKNWKQRFLDDKNYYKLLTPDEQIYMDKVHDNFFKVADRMNPRNCITHGDFDNSNCMMIPNSNHLQVIDCEDMGYGHDAGDFCTWFGAYGEDFLDAMIENYQLPVDEYFKQRVRFYWLRIPLNYFRYASEQNNLGFIDFGKNMLRENMKKFPN
ncbi:aminoglycoside phosphotransferase family protein [Patescibacteria group bacterium]|nr:aminoglycoside phosphotransferase family protein [Patescibacteria group bacterium]